MKITITQKIIKIGDSAGVTIPAKVLKKLGLKVGDMVEINVRKLPSEASDEEVLKSAESILKRYRKEVESHEP